MAPPKSRRVIRHPRFPENAKPDYLMVDSGRDFLSTSLSRQVALLGIDLATTPPVDPRRKHVVEEVLRTQAWWSLAELERALLKVVMEVNRTPARAAARRK